MDRFDRIFQLHGVLENARRPVPLARIQDALECSRATATRIINAMRLYLGAPIAYHRERILSMAARPPSPRHFGLVAAALTSRRRSRAFGAAGIPGSGPESLPGWWFDVPARAARRP